MSDTPEFTLFVSMRAAVESALFVNAMQLQTFRILASAARQD
jgi:hypothetical protein